jgi:hypothetical protein
MPNQEIIINREQALALMKAIKDCLDNERAYQIKINITDDAIMFTAYAQSKETKLCSN